MKKTIASIVLLTTMLSVSANNFNMPQWGNNNGYNNGSSWNMPNMNWGNGNNNGYNNNSNWNMPNMNWGNNNGGSNWSMPNMNWGNGNSYNNNYNSGSSWNMPNMNWGSSNNNGYNNGFNNGSNWNMPSFNMNNNNGQQPWAFGNNKNPYYNNKNMPYYPYAPQVQGRKQNSNAQKIIHSQAIPFNKNLKGKAETPKVAKETTETIKAKATSATVQLETKVLNAIQTPEKAMPVIKK